MNKLQKNMLEWAVFGLSLLLILTVLGILIWDGLQQSDTPPQIVLSAPQISHSDGQLRVQITATNTGDQAAEDVLIEVRITPPGEESELGSFKLALLASQESRNGEILFHTTASDVQVETRLISYAIP